MTSARVEETAMEDLGAGMRGLSTSALPNGGPSGDQPQSTARIQIGLDPLPPSLSASDVNSHIPAYGPNIISNNVEGDQTNYHHNVVYNTTIFNSQGRH